MTPGDNGASTPEDDDPFGYLYADGQARGAQPPSGSGGYGYPNAVSRVRPVGERTYGGQQQTAPQYGGQTIPQQPGGYGQQPSAAYQAPETFPGGAPTTRQTPPGQTRGRGPNTKGLLIGAIAVVAAVVIGISVAMLNGNDDDNKASNGASTTPTQSASASPSPSSSSSVSASGDIDPVDAKAFRLDGGASLASDVKGARADGGIYVTNLNQTGAGVTWTVDGIPADGLYTVFAHYSAVTDSTMTLKINGKEFGSKFPLDNYTHQSDPANAWTTSYTYPTLTKGTNTISLSCQSGDSCNVLLDQLWVKQGKHTNKG
ncbi:carbohydrate-binding protein [Streptomyces arenae]|uniref:carbohydrate-binding protein n=1 Tax=Streptomyces arenae TaxID=29301 RepID=UPI0026584CFE|nr:carbohydrate-binding protein [Streptomyces arenae]MCG7210432.1 carbohydrate-binding protein [Streptomyces arenae]